MLTPVTGAAAKAVGQALTTGAPIPGAKAEIIRGVSKAKEEPAIVAPKAEPVAAAPKPVKVAKPLTRAEIARQRAAEARAAPAAATTAKEVSAERSKPKITIGRKEPVAPPERGVAAPKPTAVAAERVGEVEAAERQPEAPSLPAAQPEAAAAKPARSEASRHAADLADRSPALQRSTVSELMEYRDTLQDVAAEVVTRKRREQPGLSVAEAARASADEIATTVKARLTEAQQAFDERSVAAEEAVSTRKIAAKAEAAKEVSAKRAKQAAAPTGQTKQRAGAKKGMSAEGIPTQSDKSVLGQEEKELKKKPKLRDQLVMQHAQLIRERQKPETTAERRKEIAELEAAVKEQRIEKARAEAEEGPGLSEAHREVEAALEEATADLPLPDIPAAASTSEQAAVAREHLAAFLKAIEGIKVAGRHDRKANSPLENLAVFAHKLRKKEQDVTGMGAGEFWQAQYLVENGQLEEFTNLVTNEKIKGSELREETTGEEGEVTERLEEGEIVDRTRRQGGEEASTEMVPFLRSGRGTTAKVRILENQLADRRISKTQSQEIQAQNSKGENIFVQARTYKARDLLNRMSRYTEGGSGFMAMLRHVLIRHLKQLVGDVPVNYISREDMDLDAAGVGRQDQRLLLQLLRQGARRRFQAGGLHARGPAA